MALDTRGWTEYYFEYSGIQFVTKVSPTSRFAPMISRAGEERWTEMQKQAVAELIVDISSQESILKALEEINFNSSHCVLELA